MLPVDLDSATRMANACPAVFLCTRWMEKTNVMALSRYSVVSQNPPRLMLTLAPSRFSLKLLLRSGDFVLGVPDVTSLEDLHYSGLHTGRAMDKLQVMELPTSRARLVSPLLVANCIGHLECEVVSKHRFGDCVSIVGQIVFALADKEYWRRGWLDNANLLFHLGGARYLVGERVIEPQGRREPRHAIPPPPTFDDPWADGPPRSRELPGNADEIDW